MRIDVYLPLLLAGIFGLVAPSIARRLPPPLATWLLSVGGVICAAGSGAALGFLGWTLVGQTPDVAADGHWSIPALRAHDLVPTPVAVVALLAFTVALASAVTALIRRIAATVAAYRLADTLATHDGHLVVVDDQTVPACAVPGRPGRIVVPAWLIRHLDVTERRALLGHERAHLTHHHHLHHAAGLVAAAANPLLHRLPAAILLATERWADEDAATRTGRDTVARALHRAAVTSGRTAARPGVVLSAAADHVLARVAALASPPPRPAAWRVVILTTLIAATALYTLEAAHDTERLFELAMHAYRTTH